MDMTMTTQGMSHSAEGMMMYFHTNSMVYILFQSFHVTTDGALIGACFGVFILGVIYEALKAMRELLFYKLSKNKVSDLGSKEPLDESFNAGAAILSVSHVVQSLLHVIQVVISFFLMLIFMTYNVWLCVSVVLGAGVGYFIFGWYRAGRQRMLDERQEHCN